MKIMTRIALGLAAILTALVCLIWFGFGRLIALVAFNAEAYWLGYGALALGCAPTAMALTVGWYIWRNRKC